MDPNLKRKLTSLKKIDNFSTVFKKLITDKVLSYEEQAYILGTALLFLKAFEQDKRHTSFLELGYYIILKYSTDYNDYRPLYDFSVNFGFFPVASVINTQSLVPISTINDFLFAQRIEDLKNNENKIVETYEQSEIRTQILNDSTPEISYIAPTSFGKSSIIIEHIKTNKNNKIAIIVPTKSLLNQTYKSIKDEGLDYRIIIHDDMYNNEKKFIGVFTQERALRLLDNDSLYFDILYIDEAHNLLKKQSRSYLISRLINKNKQRNPEHKIMYLSPLIENSKNLKIKNNQNISEHKINYNVKEPEYYEYTLNGEVFKYNRFTDDFYFIKNISSATKYIITNSTNKTMIYLRRPVHIEKFAKELLETLPDIAVTEELQSLLIILEQYVHKDFNIIKLLKKGVIYLHGKLPDRIKDYLEYKFNVMNELKYVIANSVILEGVNLPITSLFILSTWALQGKELTNLIGRVNRLNNIFVANQNRLELLMPQIHFVTYSKYNSGDMRNKIKQLRSKVFKDEINNPILCNYDIENIDIHPGKDETKEEKKDKILEENKKILATEDILLSIPKTPEDELLYIFVKNNIAQFYTFTKEFKDVLTIRIFSLKMQINNEEWRSKELLDKLYEIFIKDFEKYIIEFEIKRLKESETRKYYKNFIEYSKKSLKENILNQYKYFDAIKDNNEKNKFYFGPSYGEVYKDSINYPNTKMNVYVDLSKKSPSELVNLAVIKIKMEEDFVSFTLNNFFNTMLDLKLITENEYNLIMYGTTDKYKIKLIKMGFSINVITKLETDNQLNNIKTDNNGNLRATDDFNNYLTSVDDFFKFELSKYV